MFRRLVTNKFIHGFDYSYKRFRFRTVFHQSSYSYCCCSCAYEHEYVSYITDDGEINEEICDKILGCILNGCCPHVTNVPREYTRDTRIQAVHIAAAANTVLKLNRFYYSVPDLKSEIFQLYPDQIAMFHNNFNFVKEYLDNYKSMKENSDLEIMSSAMQYATRMHEDEYKIFFESITQPEFCIRTKNRQLLQLVLDPFWTHSRLDKTLEKCFVDPALADMQNDILQYLRIFRFQFRVKVLSECAVSAIACDDDSALKSILDILKSRKSSDDLTVQLPNICEVLGKDRQRNVISEYCYKGMKMVDGDHFHLKMLHYLRQHHPENCYEQIKAAFDALSLDQKATINTVYNNCGGLTPLHCAVSDLKPQEVEFLLTMGSDIDINNKHGETPITQHLRGVEHWFVLNIKKFREVLALLIFENPDVELNKSAVEEGIKVDEFFMKRVSSQIFKISGAYILDVEEHSVFSTEDGYALNFITPLLIECGFIYSRSILLTALGKRLESEEQDYFRYYLDNPRSLQMSCRDALRKHFKNRGIHRFVSRLAAKIPKNIQDFILMKGILTASQRFL